MIDLNTIEWGKMVGFRNMITNEMSNNIYELVFPVKEGDIVVDIGASIGSFTLSIMHKNPLHVYSIEPDINYFRHLQRNTRKYPVTCIHGLIGDKEDFIQCTPTSIFSSIDLLPPSITYDKLLYLYGIEKVDFLKLDCEGGEYSLLSSDNVYSLLNTTTKIAGEFHLHNLDLKTKFKKFATDILPLVSRYKIYTVDYIDITGKENTPDFYQYYTEVLVYIDNR
jgi:FkbM family methyltransferase